MLGLAKLKPKKGVTLQDFPIPSPGPNEVLIRVKISGICGSDLKLFDMAGDGAFKKISLPIIIGHEFCGTVESVGSRVMVFNKGDRVAGETHVPCMKCYTCRTGNAHICPNQKNVGRTLNGSFAEYIALPEVSVRKVPEDLTDREVAMLEPLGVAIHAIQRTDISGDNVLVLGCGPIGLMTVAVAKALGACKIFATSRSLEKRQKALSMGADEVFDPGQKEAMKNLVAQAGEGGMGVVIDMSGSEEAIQDGLSVLRPGGTMILAGIPPNEIRLDVTSYMIYKEINLFGVFGRRLWESWYLGEALLRQKKVDVRPLMGPTFPIEDYGNAFHEAFSGKSGRVFLSP